MPFNVNVPGLGTVAVPDKYKTLDERANFIRQVAYSKGVLLEPEAPSFMEKAGGVGAGLVSGVGSLVQFPGQVAGIAGLAPMDNVVTRAGAGISEFGQGLKPEAIKRQEEARAFEVEQAAKEGLPEEFGTAIASTYKRGLLFPTIAESVPSLAGTGLGGVAARGLTAGAARLAGKELAEKTAQRAALTGAVGAGATMQGADVGADTYQKVLKDKNLPDTNEYKELAAQGLDDKEIREQLALNAAQMAAAGAGAISVGTQFLPGGAAIEKVLAGQKLGRGLIGGALKGAAGEAVQESLEEGGGQFVSNLARPGEQDLLAGVGEAAGLGAIGGIGLGGGVGALAGAVEGSQERTRQRIEAEAAAAEEERVAAERRDAEIPNIQLLQPVVPPSIQMGQALPEVETLAPTLEAGSTFRLNDILERTSEAVQNEGDATLVANELLNRGLIVQEPTPEFNVLGEDKSILGTFATKEEADAKAEGLGGFVMEQPKFRVLSESERIAPALTPDKRYVYAVPAQQEGEIEADKYRVEIPGMKFKRDIVALDDANKIAEQIGNRIKTDAEKKFDPQIEQRQKAIKTIDTALEEARLRPSVSDTKLGQLEKAADVNKTRLQNEIAELETKKAEAIKVPTVTPINPRPSIIEGYEVREYRPGAPAKILQPFIKRDEAEAFIVKNAPAEQLEAIRQDTTPERETLRQRLIKAQPTSAAPEVSTPQTLAQEPTETTPMAGTQAPAMPATPAAIEPPAGAADAMAQITAGAPESTEVFKPTAPAVTPATPEAVTEPTPQVATPSAPEAATEAPATTPEEAPPIQATPQLEEKVQAVASRLRPVLDQMGLKNIGLNIQQRLQETINGKITPINGYYFNKVITAALEGEREGRGVEATVGHESIHALRELGMFSDNEWKILSKKAKNEWIQKYDIRSRYDNVPLNEERIIEEAVADAYGDWFAGRLKETGVIRGLFNRIKNFLDRVGSVFRGQGFTTSSDVFQRAFKGELQGESVERSSGEKVYSAQPDVSREKLFSMAFKPPKEGNFKNWFRNSKIVNEDGTPQIWYHGTARDIDEFRPKQANAIFLTTDPEFAENFADSSISWMVTNATEILEPQQIVDAIDIGIANAIRGRAVSRGYLKDWERQVESFPLKGMLKAALNSPMGDYVISAIQEQLPTGENIMPLVVRAEKPFDYDNSEHLDDLIAWAKSLDKRNPAREFVEDNKNRLELGAWEVIESPAVQGFLKERGYDGFYVSEGGNKNLAVYDPNQVKSPFNSGLWGPTGNISYSLPFTRSEAPRILKNGEIVGSPPNARTVAAREGLVSSMADLLMHPYAMLNESYDWYEKSGAAIRRFARGDKALTERMVRLFALYSQANGVGGNTTAVISSIAQLARGESTAFAGRFPNTTAARIPALLSAPTMDDTIPGVDDKLMNFYRNLHDGTYQTDTFDGASTIDRWMMRLFGYPHTDDQEVGGASAVSATQYAYGKDLIKRIAAEHKKRTGRDLKAHQVQAVLWTYVKNDTDYNALSPEKQKDFKPSIVNFADYVRRATANVTWESRPSTAVELIPGIHDAPRNQKEAFNRDVRALFVDENGVDIIAQLLNAIPLYTSNVSIGAYENRITPNVVTELVLGKDDGTYLSNIANKYAAALGYILKQDAVPWYRADPTASGKLASKGYRVSLKEGTITPEMEDALFNHLNNVMPGVGFTRVDSGLDFVNFRGKDGKPFFMKDNDYEKTLKSALASFDHDVHFNVTPFKTESQYISNDWKEQPNGEGYLERFSESELANLQGFLEDRSKAYIALAEDYGQRYGWSKPATEGERLQREAVTEAKATLDEAAPPPQPEKGFSVPFKSAKAGSDATDSLVKKIPVVSGLLNKIADISANNSALIYKFLTLGQLAEVVGDRLPQVKRYHDTLKDMFGYRDTLINGAAKIAEEWQSLTAQNPTVANNMANVMHDATMAGFDPSPDRRVAPAATAQEKDIQQRFDALPEEYKKLYKKVRNYYSWRMSEYMKLLETRIEDAVQDKKKARELMLRLKDRYETGKSPQPYFPLARFGDYWLYFERNGVPEYHMFENVRERDTFMQQVVAQGATNIERGLRLEGVVDAGKSAFGFIKDLMDNIDTRKDVSNLKDDIWQMYLQHLPEVSMRKHFIHRKNVLGFNNDALRAFQTNAFHGAYYMGRLKYAGIAADQLNGVAKEAQTLARANDDFATKAGSVFNELVSRQESIMNPKDSNVATQIAGGVGFAYYLATPAAALVNLTQNLLVGIPVMGAKFGYGRASAELSLAMKQFISSAQFKIEDMNVPEVERGLKNSFDIIRTLEQLKREAKGSPALEKKYDLEIRAINEMYLNGTITRSQAMDLAGATDSATLSGGKLATTNRFLGMAFHGAEVFNRTTTAMAAYRLAMKQLESSAKGLSQEERHRRAVQTASDVVEKAHFNYSDANTAPVLKSLGTAGKVIFMFKKYSQAMTYLLVNETRLYGQYLVNKYKGTEMEELAVQRAKEARDTMLGVLGMTGTFAGVLGLPYPLMAVTMALFNMTFGDDDDEEFDAETRFKNTMAEMFGADAAIFIANGPISYLSGADFASRVGLNSLWFRDINQPKDEIDATREYMIQMLGPVAGMVLNVSTGMKHINDGNIYRGIEAMLPNLLKDQLQTYRYATEGVLTLKGDPVVDEVSTYEAFLTAIGFTPSRVARQYKENSEIKGAETRINNERKRILGRFAIALNNDDFDSLSDIQDDIDDFNSRFPEYEITGETLTRSIRAREQAAAEMEHGIRVGKRLRETLGEGRYLNED